jgi:transposase
MDTQGHSIMEIAKILHISHGTVDNDLLYLRKQAQENLQKHIQERISESCSWNKQGSKDMLEYHN